jgi:hypothetical protein
METPGGADMEVRRIVLTSLLGLATGLLFFWITWNLLDRGFYAVLKSVFP